jgi:hypothetical protein
MPSFFILASFGFAPAGANENGRTLIIQRAAVHRGNVSQELPFPNMTAR